MVYNYELSFFLIVCIVAGYTDLRFRRVPNLLTFGAMAAITALSASHGILSMFIVAASAVGVLIVGSFIFGMGWLGGGDIKLLAVGAGAIGFPHFLVVMLYVAVAGGVLGALYALRERRLRTVVASVALSALAGTNVTPAPGSRRIPYAIAICAGSFFYAASESFAPWFRLAH